MKRLVRSISYIVNLCLLLICLSGCGEYNYSTRIVVYDIQDNRIIKIDNKYILNQGHSYDIEYDENGVDITLHFEEQQ